MADALVFTGLYPSRDLSTADVVRLVARLSKADSPRPLVFETWATQSDIRHFVGRRASDTGPVRLLLGTQLPGSVLARSTRFDEPDLVIRLTTRGALPLGAEQVEAGLFSLYGALQGTRKHEALGIQVVVGKGRRPERTPQKMTDPSQPVISAVLRGERLAPSDVHRRLTDHRAESRLDVTVRLAVKADHPERRRQLLSSLLGSLRTLEAPGVKIMATSERTRGWMSGALAWAPLTLNGSLLVPFLAWPLGANLPGQPDVHPLLLAPSFKLPKHGTYFADTLLPGRTEPVHLTPEARSQHVALTGGTGAGKSTVLASLFVGDVEAGRAALLLDPKKQLVDAILHRLPKERAGRVVIIDASEKQPVGMNPLDVGDRDPDIVVDGILAVFKQVFSDGWGPRTEDLLHAGLLSLARSGQKRGTPHTLLDLPKLISDDAFRRSVVGRVQDEPILADYWATFDNLSPAHRASIIAAPMNKLRKYVMRKNIAAVLGQSQPRFRLRDIFKEDKAVLVPLNDSFIGPLGAQLLGGLVVAEAWLAAMERAQEDRPMDRPAAIYLDEAQRFTHFPTSIEDALATSRSYGVAWVLAFQGRSQVSPSFGKAVELNARNKMTFAASATDARELAKSTSKLKAEDFQSLKPHQLYIDLVDSGAPAGWFSVTALPPSKALGHQEVIREANTRLFGAANEPTAETAQAPCEEAVPETPMAITHQRRRRT